MDLGNYDESGLDFGDVDTELGIGGNDEDYEHEIDGMLGALMENEDDDLTERQRRRRWGRRGRQAHRPSVPTARERSAYRAPTPNSPVTQRQLSDALARVGNDVRRNATGIKAINAQVGRLNTRVDGIVSVNTVQSRSIAKLDKRMQLDGALNFAQGVTVVESGGELTIEPNISQLLQGAVKTGMIGGTPGAFSSPAVIGALGFLLTNPGILRNLLGQNSGTS